MGFVNGCIALWSALLASPATPWICGILLFCWFLMGPAHRWQRKQSWYEGTGKVEPVVTSENIPQDAPEHLVATSKVVIPNVVNSVRQYD